VVTPHIASRDDPKVQIKEDYGRPHGIDERGKDPCRTSDHDGSRVDPTQQGIHINPLDDGRINVDPFQDVIPIDAIHQRIDVDSFDNIVHVDPSDHAIHIYHINRTIHGTMYRVINQLHGCVFRSVFVFVFASGDGKEEETILT
jgi:hypothetical protein